MSKNRLKLGATGAFPDGKLDESDEGELRLAVTLNDDGLVRIDFGKPVKWIAMSANDAANFGLALLRLSDSAVKRQ